MEKFITLQEDWHGHIIDLIKNEGLQFDNEGMCFGGSATALIAFLRGEESMDAFIESVNASKDMTPKKMTGIRLELQEALRDNEAAFATIREIGETYIRDKREENPNLTESEEQELRKAFWSDEAVIDARKETIDNIHSNIKDLQKYFDTKALIQNIMVNFDASKQPDLLPPGTEPGNQMDFIEMSKNIQHETTDPVQQQKNTMAVASNDFLPYTKQDVNMYISNFFKNCEELNLPMALLLESDGHAISCAYDPTVKKWLLFDMNEQPYYGKSNTKNVTAFIWKGLVENLIKNGSVKKPMIALRTQIVTYKHEVNKVKDHLKQNSSIHSQKYLAAMPNALLVKSLVNSVYYNSVSSTKLLAYLPEISMTAKGNALTLASSKNFPDIINIILSTNKIPDQFIIDAMEKAITKNHAACILQLILSPNTSNQTADLGLTKAIELGKVDATKTILGSKCVSKECIDNYMRNAMRHNNSNLSSIIASEAANFGATGEEIYNWLIPACVDHDISLCHQLVDAGMHSDDRIDFFSKTISLMKSNMIKGEDAESFVLQLIEHPKFDAKTLKDGAILARLGSIPLSEETKEKIDRVAHGSDGKENMDYTTNGMFLSYKSSKLASVVSAAPVATTQNEHIPPPVPNKSDQKI